MSRTLSALAVLASTFALPLFAATITVNSTADVIAADAQCTLREAITAANTNAAIGGCVAGTGATDVIAFAIGSGAQTIVLTSALPSITEAVVLDASTQPGFVTAPLVTVNGGGTVSSAFTVEPTANGTSIVGFVLNGFSGAAIDIFASSTTVSRSYIGTNAAGNSPVPNGVGIQITGSATAPALNNVIDRSRIAGNTGDGIRLIGAQSTTVTNNQIGIFPAAPNGGSGVRIESSATSAANNNIIGSATDNATGGNTIEQNGEFGGTNTGVTIVSGTGNRVVGNSMSFNATPGTGIYLGGDGATPNDACDADAGANLLQNKPVLTNALYENGNVTIRGLLNSTASSTFTIHFYFSIAASFDQGTHYIGSTTVQTNAGCVVQFNATFAFTPQPDEGTVIATATDTANNTSEQSQPTLLVAPLQVAKGFSPATVNVQDGGVSRLTITITFPFFGLGNEAVNLAFTDAYPAGLQNAPNPAPETTCTGGTVTAAAGDTNVRLSGGTLAANMSCTVSVNVIATQAGALENVLPPGAVTSTVPFTPPATPTNLQPASATLNALGTGPVSVTKSFNPSNVTAGDATTLTITLSNPHTLPLTNVSFVDAYPAGLVNASAANATSTCGGTVTGNSGGTSVSLTGGMVAANGTCTVTVSVVAPNGGTISNTIPAGSVTTAEGETNDATATGVLVVAAAPAVAPVPTASEWALIALVMLLSAAAIVRMR
ncbi:MAG TPA: CSLREA domain-containing protein [Thermoanaerobaculia bacterium]